MAKAMRKSRFLLVSGMSFLLFGASYFYALDQGAIVETTFGKSYRQFLLIATDTVAKRIIVESGSNAVHAIDAAALEKHFGRPTLIIADNAGYPLRHKIERLANHLKGDDLLVLPLEWLAYRADKTLPDDYVQSILDQDGSNAFYYRELSWLQRVAFVYQSVPLKLGIKRLLRGNGLASQKAPGIDADRQTLQRFDGEIRQSARGSELTDIPPAMDSLTGGLACDHYLFGLFEFPDISELFRENLQQLVTLRQNTGAQIIFAWPAVVARDGDECYQLYNDQIRDYAQRIQTLVEQHGFRFLGNPQQSRFDHTCMLDTYYHVRARCAAIYTQNLIRALEGEGIKRETGFDSAALNQHLLDGVNLAISRLAPEPADSRR